MNESIKKTIEALKKNNIEAYYAETKEQVTEILISLIDKDGTVAFGGSVTLNQLGFVDYARKHYNVIDRYKEGLTAKEREDCYREGLLADTFLTSCNALTEKGELVNVDGTGNRLAAIVYGPKSVITVAGANKIVKDAQEGLLRVKRVAAPKNCERLNCATYCKEKGECAALGQDGFGLFDGCQSPGRICCHYLVSGYQRIKGRIKVIICAQELGY